MLKKSIGLFMMLLTVFAISGCTNAAPPQSSAPSSSPPSALLKSADSISGDTIAAPSETQESSPSESSKDNENVSSDDLEETETNSKILVAYFSCTGTTKALAEITAEILGADLYEIVPVTAYTTADLNYGDSSSRATKEQSDPNARPEIMGTVKSIDGYDTIVLAYPIWWGEAPRIISTFLESYDLGGKTILPFCTSHSSGAGSSANNLHSLTPDTTTWTKGQRFSADASREELESWLIEVGVAGK